MVGEKFGDMLKIAAQVAVLSGLLMVLVEMDQTNDLARAEFHQTRANTWGDLKLDLADSEFLLPAWQKFRDAGGPADRDAMDVLDDIERARVVQFLLHRYNDYDNLYYQYREGYLDEEYYQYRVVPSIRNLAYWWESIGVYNVARPSFVEEVKRIAAEPR